MSDEITVDTGNAPLIEVEFTDSAGDDADPNFVYLRWIEPDGTFDSWQYGVDAEVIKDSVGHYHAYLPVSDSGRWAWQFQGLDIPGGASVASDDGVICVRRSVFAGV